MPNINIRKIIYTLRHKYLTLNNVVIAVAFLIAANWVWGALDVMQRNYSLQKEVDAKRRQLALTELERDSLSLQQRYYQTEEYQELEVRRSLGLVRPGEKVLILVDNGTQADTSETTVATAQNTDTVGNLEQWLNFLFGGYSQSVEQSSED